MPQSQFLLGGQMLEAQSPGIEERPWTFRSSKRKVQIKPKVGKSQKFKLSPRAKLTLNALLARDAYQLNPRERRQIMFMPVFDRALRVPASCFKFRMIGKRKQSNVVSFDRAQIDHIPLFDNDIFVFIDEIVRQRTPYRQTILYEKLISGKLRKLIRPLKSSEDPRNRTKIESEEEFKRYYDRCMSLADSIAKDGIFDMLTQDGYAQGYRFGHDRNMLVAIDEHGELIHWRMAKHRLAIALALDIESMPVNVGFLSGHWILSVAGRSRLLRRNGLVTAIALALDEAERRANA